RYIGVLDPPGQFLAGAKLESSKDQRQNQKTSQYYTFDVDGDPLPFFQKNKIQFEMGQSRLRVVDRFTNEEKWDTAVDQAQQVNSIVGQSHTQNPPVRVPAATDAHLAIVQTA